MLTISELREISAGRMVDAEVLLNAGRYDGAIYLCGYPVELTLKAKIYETLNWEGYTSTNNEFQSYLSFRTHDLDILLRLTGVEHEVKNEMPNEWSIVAEWDPEVRYTPPGHVLQLNAEAMVRSAQAALRFL